MPGARCARSLACKIKKHTSIVTTVTPVTPGIPRAMVLTVSFALSPVTGLCCHCRQRKYFRQLDASVGASGPHDFAVRLSVRSSSDTLASTASRPAFVTIAIRPSVGRDGATNEVICFGEERKYFCKWGWTAKLDLPVRQSDRQSRTAAQSADTTFLSLPLVGSRRAKLALRVAGRRPVGWGLSGNGIVTQMRGATTRCIASSQGGAAILADENARALRKRLTPEEVKLWTKLRELK